MIVGLGHAHGEKKNATRMNHWKTANDSCIAALVGMNVKMKGMKSIIEKSLTTDSKLIRNKQNNLCLVFSTQACCFISYCSKQRVATKVIWTFNLLAAFAFVLMIICQYYHYHLPMHLF